MDTYQCPVAVLLLVFNRPQLTNATFERIREVRPPRLYVHCDGAREGRAGEEALVAQTRCIVAAVDWPCVVLTLFRTENAGLRNGVSGAISWFFEHEKAGIILEDDCLADHSFFRFCAELLERYADDEHVMHIGGSNLLGMPAHDVDDYFWSKFSLVWGWASWQRAWQKMDLSMNQLHPFEQAGAIRNIIQSTPAQVYMMDKFKTVKAGKLPSWAYSWFYSILIHDGLCIIPSKNLIQNTGIGSENATNTTASNATASIAAVGLVFPLKHPNNQDIEPNTELQLFYLTQKRQIRLWIWYLLHLIKLR